MVTMRPCVASGQCPHDAAILGCCSPIGREPGDRRHWGHSGELWLVRSLVTTCHWSRVSQPWHPQWHPALASQMGHGVCSQNIWVTIVYTSPSCWVWSSFFCCNSQPQKQTAEGTHHHIMETGASFCHPSYSWAGGSQQTLTASLSLLAAAVITPPPLQAAASEGGGHH